MSDWLRYAVLAWVGIGSCAALYLIYRIAVEHRAHTGARLEAQARTTAREARDRHSTLRFTRPIGALSAAEYDAWCRSFSSRSYASIKLEGRTIHAASWAALMEDK